MIMTAPHLLLGTNWKMNKTVEEAKDYVQELLQRLATIKGADTVQLFLIPPFTAIAPVKQASEGKFWVGAQNMHWEESGAFTGEISPSMLQELGVDLVELGHAERRQHFNESDEDVNRKVLTALKHALRPVLCLGESARDREYQVELETVARQLKIAVRGVELVLAHKLIVAYEPLWAIGGKGTAATSNEVRRMIRHIRAVLMSLFDGEVASAIPVVYGGDVNVRNAPDFLNVAELDGLFVGRAGWHAHDFAQLVQVCAQVGVARHCLRNDGRARKSM